MMADCINCGYKVAETAKFCPKCGEQLNKVFSDKSSNTSSINKGKNKTKIVIWSLVVVVIILLTTILLKDSNSNKIQVHESNSVGKLESNTLLIDNLIKHFKSDNIMGVKNLAHLSVIPCKSALCS